MLILIIAIVVAILVLGFAANQMYVKRVRGELQSGEGEDSAEMTPEMRDVAAGDAHRLKLR